MNLKEGDDVMYEGKETFIEKLRANTAVIRNPYWSDEDEADLDEIYWLTVDKSKLTEVK